MTNDPAGGSLDRPDPQPPAYPPAPPSYGTPPSAPDLSGYRVNPGAPGAPATPAYGTGPGQQLNPSDERMWAMFAHLGGVLVSFVVPLVIYLVYKDRSRYVREQSAEALNWQITLAIGYLISVILIIVLIGFLTLLALSVASLVFGIIAAIAANRGENYRYPFALRLVS